MSRIDEAEAKETLRILDEIGQYEPEFEQYKTSLE
jgi:hydrogenase maturation factor